jgi:hypothetical protein
MNNASLLNADRATHVKIVAVALALATLVSGMAVAARLNVADFQIGSAKAAPAFMAGLTESQPAR